MLKFAAVLFVFFTAIAGAPLGKVSPSPHPRITAAPIVGPLLSPRALRRARLLIQMRMLQLRDERLECVRDVILRRLPADLRPTGAFPSVVKQSDAGRAITGNGSFRWESEDCTWTPAPRNARALKG